jgi:hypothetical protein
MNSIKPEIKDYSFHEKKKTGIHESPKTRKEEYLKT